MRGEPVLRMDTPLGERWIRLSRKGQLMLPDDADEIRAMDRLRDDGRDIIRGSLRGWRAAIRNGDTKVLEIWNKRFIATVYTMCKVSTARQLKHSDDPWSTYGSHQLRLRTLRLIHSRCRDLMLRHFPWILTVQHDESAQHGIYYTRRAKHGAVYHGLRYTLNWWRRYGRTGRGVMLLHGRAVIVTDYGPDVSHVIYEQRPEKYDGDVDLYHSNYRMLERRNVPTYDLEPIPEEP